MVSKVYVVGAGMGNPAMLTVEGQQALDQSELIIGSARLLEDLASHGGRKVALVTSHAIAQELRAAQERVATVLMSGDIGFYSGATKLFDELSGMDVEAVPGVSSLAYLCAKLHVPWEDVQVVSAHGRDCDACGTIQSHRKTFVLLGGADTPGQLCTRLVEAGLPHVRIAVGERLSCPDERVACGTAAEFAGRAFDKLCVLLAQNDTPLSPSIVAPHLSDDAFVRGRVPMTKEEVRELAICKLRIAPGDTVWDIGAGTGSVSVEAARAAYAGRVIAVEKSDEALGLLAQNKERFALSNLHVVAGEAPDALVGLTKPDCVFVGGSSGHLKRIVGAVLEANPDVRLCIAAVTLETLTAALACVQEYELSNVDIAQISVTKARELGKYHLMEARNPVYLVCAGDDRACANP